MFPKQETEHPLLFAQPSANIGVAHGQLLLKGYVEYGG
jgi:hypothetical protein